jgi:hypothetical protein
VLLQIEDIVMTWILEVDPADCFMFYNLHKPFCFVSIFVF